MKPEIIKSYTSFAFSEGCWATSDLHFMHKNGAAHRNMSLGDMHDAIFEGNKIVGKRDLLYILGDIALCNAKSLPALEVLIRSLRGRKILVIGNHDKYLNSNVLNCFEHVTPYLEATIPKESIRQERKNLCVMSHYPMISWNKMHYGSWHLHGHCHGNLKVDLGMSQDVGLDCNSMKPFSFEQIAQIMSLKQKVKVDHHE